MKKKWKNLGSCIPFLGMLSRFIETKQVSACSSQVCGGSTGINAWNKFVLRVEHPYIVRKLEKSLDMSEPPSMLKLLHVTNCSSKSKGMF